VKEERSILQSDTYTVLVCSLRLST